MGLIGLTPVRTLNEGNKCVLEVSCDNYRRLPNFKKKTPYWGIDIQ
jgi:hypothetical protein